MTVSDRPASVEQRVRALQDERAIRRLLFRYARAFDYGTDAEEAADFFTEDGVWWSSIDGRWAGASGLRKQGRDEIRRWFGDLVPRRGKPGSFSHHVVWNPMIDVDGDRATVECYAAMLRETPEGPLVYAMGRYRDALVRGTDGKWRFKERHYSREAVHPSGQALPAG